MTTTVALAAYHGDPALKTRVLAQLAEHQRQDQIVQGIYWDQAELKGCAVGCLLHDSNGAHERYETEFGIPEQLAWLEDGIFEALTADEAKSWPLRFMSAIPVGADLTTVWPRMAVWLMADPEWGLEHATEADDVKQVCRQVAAGYERILAGTLTDEQAQAITDAARAAWAARDARAARAALGCAGCVRHRIREQADRPPRNHNGRSTSMTSTKNETPLERQVREEQEQHEHTLNAMGEADQDAGVLANDLVTDTDDDQDDDEPIVDAGGQTAIVDRTQYEREDLQIPKIDGETIGRVRIKFSGQVMLDRSDPSDVAVYNAITLGHDITLLVEAKCSATGAKGNTNRDGDLDVVVGEKVITVHSLMKPAGADWITDTKATA